jgi:hypothetical protein
MILLPWFPTLLRASSLGNVEPRRPFRGRGGTGQPRRCDGAPAERPAARAIDHYHTTLRTSRLTSLLLGVRRYPALASIRSTALVSRAPIHWTPAMVAAAPNVKLPQTTANQAFRRNMARTSFAGGVQYRGSPVSRRKRVAGRLGSSDADDASSPRGALARRFAALYRR